MNELLTCWRSPIPPLSSHFARLASTYLSGAIPGLHTHLCSETPTLQYVRISVLYVAAWALWPMLGPV